MVKQISLKSGEMHSLATKIASKTSTRWCLLGWRRIVGVATNTWSGDAHASQAHQIPNLFSRAFIMRIAFGSSLKRLTARVTPTSWPIPRRSATQRLVIDVRLRTTAATISCFGTSPHKITNKAYNVNPRGPDSRSPVSPSRRTARAWI